MSSKFRVNAKSVFLTYPKCLLTKEELITHLKTLKHTFNYYCVCIEAHEDGTPHLHCVLKFNKKVDIRNETYFDLQGYHPNIQTTKNINASINYIKKDGNYLEDGVCDFNTNDSRSLPEYNEVTYRFLESLFIGYEQTGLAHPML
jgi:hypothetical protein